MKYTETTYGNPHKSIVKFLDHYVNLAVTVSDAGITANADGRKVVLAGTILGGGFLASESVLAVETNGAGAEGVLFYDVDVTDGPAPGAALIHGFVALDALPAAPAAEAVTALNQVTFLK